MKGAGVTLALPLLDAMIPAATALAQTRRSRKLRMGFFYIPHGIMATRRTARRWTGTPSGSWADFKLRSILAPLEAHKKYGHLVWHLENRAMIAASKSGAGDLAERDEAGQGPPGPACPSRSIRWWRRTSARTPRCRRSSWPRRPRSRPPPAAARRASTTPRCRSATRTTRLPWSTTRARCSRSCSGRGHAGRALRGFKPDPEPAGPHSRTVPARYSAICVRAIGWCWTTTWKRSGDRAPRAAGVQSRPVGHRRAGSADRRVERVRRAGRFAVRSARPLRTRPDLTRVLLLMVAEGTNRT